MSFSLRKSLRSLPYVTGLLVAASCSIDTSQFEFDDDKFEELQDDEDDAPGAGMGGMGGEGGIEPEDCTGTELRCDGKQVQVCTGDTWLDVGGPCEFACVDGTCTGSCVPGSTECVSNVSAQICSETGEWETSFCQFACVDDACGGECKPGMRQCGGDGELDRERCDDGGSWISEGTCDSQCTDGVCTGSCTNGDTQCIGDAEHPQQVTCASGSWDPADGAIATDCDYVCVEGECSGVCTPGDTRCAPGSPSTGRQTCTSVGQWGATSQCQYVCSGDGECTGTCKPGDLRCKDGELQACNNTGNWTVKANCEKENLSCINFGEGRFDCAECTPRTARCDNASRVSCNEKGYWEESEECDGVCYRASCWRDEEVCKAHPSEAKGCLKENNMVWGCKDTTFIADECPTGCLAGNCPDK